MVLLILHLFARVEQGGLGISSPPGIDPGWTHYQQSLAHHLRHKIIDTVNQTSSHDFEFCRELDEIPCRNVYSTPRPPAKAMARWNRSFWQMVEEVVTRTRLATLRTR